MLSQVRVVDVSITPDPAILAAGEVIADNAPFTILRALGIGGTLDSVAIVDESTQGAALSVVFFDVATSVGTPNAAPSISAVNAAGYLGHVTFATTDYLNLTNSRVAVKGNLGIGLKATSATQQVGIALVNGAGTPTYGATVIKLRLGIRD